MSLHPDSSLKSHVLTPIFRARIFFCVRKNARDSSVSCYCISTQRMYACHTCRACIYKRSRNEVDETQAINPRQRHHYIRIIVSPPACVDGDDTHAILSRLPRRPPYVSATLLEIDTSGFSSKSSMFAQKVHLLGL